jgi:hypothetical protein
VNCGADNEERPPMISDLPITIVPLGCGALSP